MPSEKQPKRTAPSPCTLYILRCSDASLYTGITFDLARRVRLHNTRRGARYTRTRGPVTVVLQRVFASHTEAARAEVFIKRAHKTQRERLVAEGWGYFEKYKDYFESRKRSKIKSQALLKRTKERHPAAYQPWTKTDDDRLLSEFQIEKSTKELSKLLRRSPEAIRSRLRRLGF